VATKASNSSGRMLIIGALVLVVGVILVLLVLRADAATPAASPEGGDGDVAAAGQDAAGEPVGQAPRAMTVEELSSNRLPLPPEVPDGSEAVAVRASFVRGLAAIPSPGDLVNLYRAGNGGEGVQVDDAELVLGDLEVLAVIGPLPTQNEGEVTFLLAVDPADVPGLLPVAGSSELWFTLLPQDDAEAEA
jgi:hypothetical protein